MASCVTPPEEPGHRLDRPGLTLRQEMSVGPRRLVGIGVSQSGRDGLDIHAGDQQQRGTGMPQVMEENALDAGPLQQGLPVADVEVATAEGARGC
jgi:hypothetical protein